MDSGESNISTIDGYTLSYAVISILSVGIVLFLIGSIFTVWNACKFFNHRSFPLVVFYVLMLMDFLSRVAYYSACFFYRNSKVNIVFEAIIPAICVSIGIC